MNTKKRPIINLGLGCANFGSDYNGAHLTYDQSRDLVERCVELGITTFDTSSQYGLSEIYLKHALKGFKRPFDIITKFHPTDWRKQVLRSVERFKGHLLTVLWHNWSRDNKNLGIMEQMLKLSKAHNFRFGASTYGYNDAHAAITSGYFRSVEIEFSLINWKAQYNLVAIAKANNVDLIFRSILARGYLVKDNPSPYHDLAKRYNIPIDELSLRFIKEFINWETVLVGVENPDQLYKFIENVNKPYLNIDLLHELKEIDFELDMRNI